MSNTAPRLSFERPILELETRLEFLKKQNNSEEVREEIQRLRLGLADLRKKIYANLTAWETVEVARHPDRPQTVDYIDLIFDEFVELYGDKFFGDDRAIRTGWAKLDEFKVMLVGHQKGRNVKERQLCHFGCALPEGYRKAMSKMKMAAKFGIPVICLVDTPGAFPGIESEERGISQTIAESMYEMSILGTPIICVVIGEGGSGGALGICVGDRVAMLEHSYYSVISPEGCAGILWKSGEFKDKAAEALKFTSTNLLEFGIIDDVIQEPDGGAHSNPNLMAARLKQYLRLKLRELKKVPLDELVAKRYDRFRKLGVFVEQSSEQLSNQEPKP